LQDFLSKADHKNVVIVSHDAVIEMFVQLFNLNYEFLSAGSYLRYDLSFDPNNLSELGKLTPFKNPLNS